MQKIKSLLLSMLMLVAKIIIWCLLAGLMWVGVLGYKHRQKWFTRTVEIPNENDSQLVYNRMQMIVVYLMCVKLCVLMLWIL